MMGYNNLYFTTTASETVHRSRRRSPYQEALAHLAAYQPTGLVELAVTEAFRFRFGIDDKAAGRVMVLLVERGAGFNLRSDMGYMEACAVTLAMGHAFQMIREELAEDVRRGWLRLYGEQVETLRQRYQGDDMTLLDFIWRTALKIVGGVVLERDDLIVLGGDDLRQIVDYEIHPEGFFPALVENSNGGALQRQVMGAKGLVLAAEAATRVGVNLWAHEARGISVKTAAIYAAAYLEYREQWQWDIPPDEAENERFYRENGAFLEMLNQQLRPAVLKVTMERLRPLADPLGGGFTTLSHAAPSRRGLFGRS